MRRHHDITTSRLASVIQLSKLPKELRELRNLLWQTDPPRGLRVRIAWIDRFDARGMTRVYGRSDRWGSRAAFNMDVWRDRDYRLFARFSSRNDHIEDISLELIGCPRELIPRCAGDADEYWSPKALRDAYADWVYIEL